MAIDATLVLKGDGTHRRKVDTTDGVALHEARKNKETTYPELGQGHGRAQLVEVVVGDQQLLVVPCLRESSVRDLSAQRQCSSSLEEMELFSRMCRRKSVRFVAGEQKGVTRCGQPGAIRPSGVGRQSAGGLSAGSFV